MRVNFQRLNHILIPSTKDGRDALRQTRVGRSLRPLVAIYLALTPEGRFLSVFWLLTGAAGLEVGSNQAYLLFSLITGILLASLLARRWVRLDDVALSIEAPRSVAVGETLTIALVLRNLGREDRFGMQAVGPLLPWDGRYAGEGGSLGHLAAGATGRIRVGLTFSARGDHHIDPFHVGRLVPLGLALGPVLASEGVRFVVRPRLANVVSVTRPAGMATGEGGGGRLVPDAVDLSGTRPYRPGDPVRDIHARSWARTGYPVVREYRQEPVASSVLLLDVDEADDEVPASVVEAAVSLAAGIVTRLSRDNSPIAALGCGGRLDWLSSVPGATDMALDALARATASSGAPVDLWSQLLLPHVRRFRDVMWVVTRADLTRLNTARLLRTAGIPVRVLVLATAGEGGMKNALPAGFAGATATLIRAEAVSTGAPIHL